MKILVIFLTSTLLVLGYRTASSKVEVVSSSQTTETSSLNENITDAFSIRNVDFKDFTFPWTKTFGHGKKSFSMRNGVNLEDEKKLSLKSVAYVDIGGFDNDEALVVVTIDDGNATYDMLYVYGAEKNETKLLESFEFGDNNIFFATAFVAHGELIIERYIQRAGDAECCPSSIEISYYDWQKDRFALQGKPQKVANGYAERLKSKNGKN